MIRITSFRNPTFRHWALSGAAAMALVAGAPGLAAAQTQPAASEIVMRFDIDEPMLASALSEYARQSGRQMLYAPDLVEGLPAPRVEGEMRASAALDALLADSGLEFERAASGAFLLRRAAEPHGVDGRSNGGAVRSAPDRQDPADEPREQALNAETAPRVIRTREDVEADEVASRVGRGQVEAIVVSGSRNVGLRRYEDDAQPYVVFDAAEIETSFATNLEDFFRTRLPMNASRETFAQQGNFVFSNQSRIDLRGLGSNQTLILVNGRRTPSLASLDDFQQGDINGIPLSAVERIEVLPATAAGIYGGGATGGAINIILKRDYTGAELVVGYDNTFDTDSGRRRFEGSFGASLEGGKTNILISASYAAANELLAQDRDFIFKARDLQLRNNPAAFNSEFPAPSADALNVRTLFGDLVFKDGRSFGTNSTFIPFGYSGLASDNGQALLDNAGQFNLDLASDSSGLRNVLVPTPTTTSYSASIRREFTPWLELFIEHSFFSNEGQTSTGGSDAIFLRPFDPGNPFDNFLFVRPRIPGAEFPSSSTSENSNTTIGARFEISDRWGAELEYGLRSSKTERTSFLQTQTPEFTAAVRSGEFDVFRDLRVVTFSDEEIERFFYSEPTQRLGPLETDLENVTLRFTGQAGDLPAGPVVFSALAEWRSEEKPDSFIDEIANDRIQYFPRQKQIVRSVYGEVLFPLIAADSLFGDELEVQLALRHDDYETTTRAEAGRDFLEVPSREGPFPPVEFQTANVSSTDYTLGLRYVPIEGVLLRASYGTGFLPPSLSQLVRVVREDNIGRSINDPKRGNGPNNLSPIRQFSGGNPSLQPEESESLSLGVVLTPSILSGFRVSFDYTRIDKTNEIARAISPSNIFDFEEQFPERVTRRELTQQDIDAGFTGGEVTFLDFSRINIASSTLEAYDFQVNYDWRSDRFGNFGLYAVATYQPTLSSEVLPGSGEVDRAGFANGPLEWRGNVGLNWDRGPWSAGWNAQYFDDYLVFSSTASEARIADDVLSQGSERIESQIYNDIFVRYNFGSEQDAWSVLNNVDFTFGIQNLFNEEPPILATAGTTGGYSTYGDPRLRRYSIQLRKSF